MTARHLVLFAGSLVLLAAALYLFIEVRAVPTLVSTPTANIGSALARAPEAVHRTGSGADSTALATGQAQQVAASAASQHPQLSAGEDDDSERANPSLDAVMDRANKAYDRADFEEARTIALGVLAKSPTNVRMMRIVVSAACIEGEVPLAQQWFDKLPKPDRDQMKTRCERYGVSFREPAQ